MLLNYAESTTREALLIVQNDKKKLEKELIGIDNMFSVKSRVVGSQFSDQKPFKVNHIVVIPDRVDARYFM